MGIFLDKLGSSFPSEYSYLKGELDNYRKRKAVYITVKITLSSVWRIENRC